MSSDALHGFFLASNFLDFQKKDFKMIETAPAGDHLAVAAGVGKGSRNTWIHIFSQDLSRCKKVGGLSTALRPYHLGPCCRCYLLSIAACNLCSLCLRQSAYQHLCFRQAVNTRAPFSSSSQATLLDLKEKAPKEGEVLG